MHRSEVIQGSDRCQRSARGNAEVRGYVKLGKSRSALIQVVKYSVFWDPIKVAQRQFAKLTWRLTIEVLGSSKLSAQSSEGQERLRTKVLQRCVKVTHT